MSKYFLGLLGIFLASAMMSVGEEFEINLVRNGNFEPGMDRQGPRDWTPYYAGAPIIEFGRGRVTFTEEGMTIGPGDLYQLGDMFDDLSPAYRITCRMKTEGTKGAAVTMKFRGGPTYQLVNRDLDVWEDLATDVVATKEHYGFCMVIEVPKGAKLTISSVKVTAVLKPGQNGGGQALISANGKDIPARGILLPAEPNWFEQLAAHELRVNIYLISGAVLPVFAGESTDDKGYIRVASLKKMISDKSVVRETKSWWRKLAGKKSAPVTEPEANGFRITCRDGRVELTGGNDAGVLAGAMHLSELLGAKFYAPRVYTIASNRTLKIPDMEIARHPAFDFTGGPSDQRQTLNGWKYGYLHPESCVAPCGEASPPTHGWVHPQLFLVPPFLYAKDHPEYYALVKGQRIEGFTKERLGAQGTEAGYLHLCLSNPDVHKIAAERIERLIQMYPQCKYISLCQNDGQLWCECEKCRSWDANGSSWTDRMIHFANAIATLLQEKHPDRKLLIFAYGSKTEDLPVKAKLHPNVQMCYALWPSSWPVWNATYCEQNKRGLKLLDDWNAFTGTNMWLFLYPVNTYENAEKIKLAAAKGIKGFYQCGLRGDFAEITLYTTGRLIWDPDADVEKIIDEIMPHLYGKAAPFMRKYSDMFYRLIFDRIAKPEQYRKYPEGYDVMFCRLPLDFAEKALDLLTKAEEAAGDDKDILQKIQKEKYVVLYGYISEYAAINPDIADNQVEGYAAKIVELINLGRKDRVPFRRGHKGQLFADWLFQTTGGALDFERSGNKWQKDKKVELFLANPAKTLQTRPYFQEKITNGWALPAKAFFGGEYMETYIGRPGVCIRRQSSAVSRTKAYFKLDALPEKEVELQVDGLDNEKEEKAEIRITVNNHEIFAGPVAFQKNKWGRQTYKVPNEYLKPGENVIMIENTTEDYKAEMVGQAGPAEEALAKNYKWGWCIIGSVRFVGWNQ